MSDRRRLWANARIAHDTLRGTVEAPRYTRGAWKQVAGGKVPLLDAPNGKRDRELLFGEPFCVLEETEGHAFGYAQRDGYAGYIQTDALHDDVRQATHCVCAPRTYMKATPDLKTFEPVFDLSFGSLVEVLEESGPWSGVAVRFRDDPENTFMNWMPSCHLRPIHPFLKDPVDVAEGFLGTPYLWGGNSGFGIDCSGLVQAALLSCGINCPGDSDMQETDLGTTLPEGTAPRRGDLLFWKGHVAMACDAEVMIHANAHHMSVVHEPIKTAIARIDAQGDGPVTRHARLASLV